MIDCTPEILDLKREIFYALNTAAPQTAILVSATSSIPASQFADGLAASPRCLVAHPVNPPHLIRVVELVPAPFTSVASLDGAAALFSGARYQCVRLGREITGFAYNRLQGAVLREAYCLVRAGVATVAEVDLLVREALGLRWSVIGPFEMIDLNTRGGIAAHAKKLGPAYAKMGAERGQNDPWTDNLVARVEHERRQILPAEEWADRVAWRDRKSPRLSHGAKAAQRRKIRATGNSRRKAGAVQTESPAVIRLDAASNSVSTRVRIS